MVTMVCMNNEYLMALLTPICMGAFDSVDSGN